MNEAVIGYFSDMGFSVVRDIALRCTSWTSIADVTPAQCREALRKIDDGTYGACENCGDPIPDARLEAMPTARLCMACASKSR